MDVKLKLVRCDKNENSTEGNLYVNDVWFCHTIEDKVRAKPGQWSYKLKVYAKTAIPYGTYPVAATWSNRFKRILTGVFNVPDFEGIRIHNGTSEQSSAGCIIVSYHNNDAHGENRLLNEKEAMNDLCTIVQTAQKTGKVTIEIVDLVK